MWVYANGEVVLQGGEVELIGNTQGVRTGTGWGTMGGREKRKDVCTGRGQEEVERVAEKVSDGKRLGGGCGDSRTWSPRA